MPTVLPSVENGLLGRGLWDKPLPVRGPQESLVNRGLENRAAGGGNTGRKQLKRKLSAEDGVVWGKSESESKAR